MPILQPQRTPRASAPPRSRPDPVPGRPLREPSDPMRGMILVLTVLFAVGAAAIRWGVSHWNLTNSLWMVSAVGMLRLTLVLGALWIAWPTVRRPAMWLPPGLAAIGLILLGACVVQPRVALVIFPAMGTLIAVAGCVRFFRNQ